MWENHQQPRGWVMGSLPLRHRDSAFLCSSVDAPHFELPPSMCTSFMLATLWSRKREFFYSTFAGDNNAPQRGDAMGWRQQHLPAGPRARFPFLCEIMWAQKLYWRKHKPGYTCVIAHSIVWAESCGKMNLSWGSLFMSSHVLSTLLFKRCRWASFHNDLISSH